MYHSITFSTRSGSSASYNTWSDWHLIPTSRPTIAHPEMVTNYVKIPGRSGSLDLTNYLYSEPIYRDRNGSFDFYVVEGGKDFQTIEREMLKALHGQKMNVIFEDDSSYYYVGRFKVESWKNEASRPRVTISYIIEPYKFNRSSNARVLGDF